MGQTSTICVLGLMLSGAVVLAAEPTGPRTLENLLTAADGEPQAAVVAEEAPNDAEEPPAALKNDPLQQRLDAALAEYNPAIETAIDELAKEIDEEFNKATKKGDIALARKCKQAEQALRERGVPPEGDFLKNARENTQRKLIRSGAKLSAEFEAVAKECLKAGDLDRAESVLSEKAELLAEMKSWKAGISEKSRAKAGEQKSRKVFVQDGKADPKLVLPHGWSQQAQFIEGTGEIKGRGSKAVGDPCPLRLNLDVGDGDFCLELLLSLQLNQTAAHLKFCSADGTQGLFGLDSLLRTLFVEGGLFDIELAANGALVSGSPHLIRISRNHNTLTWTVDGRKAATVKLTKTPLLHFEIVPFRGRVCVYNATVTQ